MDPPLNSKGLCGLEGHSFQSCWCPDQARSFKWVNGPYGLSEQVGKEPYTKMFITDLFTVEKYESNILNGQPGKTSQTHISKNISLCTQNEMPCNSKNDKVHLSAQTWKAIWDVFLFFSKAIYLFNFYWNIVDLQCCVSFRYTHSCFNW